jgi:hypothetical protein
MRVKRVCALSLPFALTMGWLAGAGSAMAAVCDGSTTSLGNGTFETPVVAPDSVTLMDASLVPPWQTTDGLGEIEIWGTGFNGVPAFEGNAFAELNANTSGTLYQDVVSTPGATMSWTLAHRARVGTDVMEVLIGDANVADVNGTTGWDGTSGPLSDDTTAWGTHTGDYVVPAGQTCTRFAFRAVSTGSGSGSVGNFLDAVSFTVTIPAPPTPTPTPGAPAPTPPPTDAVAGATHGSGSDVGPASVLAIISFAGAALAIRRRAARLG